MPVKTKNKPIDFPYAIRSFIGYLEGTHKSAHTIKNYQLDIFAFQNFLSQVYAGSSIKLHQVNRDDLDRYRDYLKDQGFKTNTRRRKILTVTQFLNYLAKRKKLDPEMAHKLPAPHKVERIPFTVSSESLMASIQQLPETTLLDHRNKVLFWTLAETGILVSEISHLRFDQWTCSPEHKAYLQVGGKSDRRIPVSFGLYSLIQSFKDKTKEDSWIFLGFNKFGSLGAPITSRGVELLVKLYGPKLGFSELTPRTFRHSIILKWFEDGHSQNEIQARLGLKTTYAFRSYEALINKPKSSLKTTSISETTQPES